MPAAQSRPEITMSQPHNHDIHVPKEALIAAGLLIALTIAAVAVFRVAGLEPTAMIDDDDPTLIARQLRFEDSEQGSVIVHEITDDMEERIVHVVPSGEGGFVRGVLRSFARARRASGIGPEHPFVLKLQSSGTLLLEDPETRQQIDLKAFGPTNIDAFRPMLAYQEADR